VKTSKRSSKEPSFVDQDKIRRENDWLEEMLSQFRTFGETLSIIREEVRGINLRANTDVIRGMHADLKIINQRLEIVEAK
jgi:hypothetical protein